MPLSDFFRGPGLTALQPGELLAELRLPAPPAGTSSAYQRHTPRKQMDIAVVGVGVALTIAGGKITRARVALGAVAPTPFRAATAEAALEGQPPTEEAFARAAEAAAAACSPIGDVRGSAEFRRHLVKVMTARMLAKAAEEAASQGSDKRSMPKQIINLRINGSPQEVAVEPSWTLLETVREALGYTGAKEGCGTGDCGACSMLVDGRLITSCLMLAPQADGREVVSIEGLATNGTLHPVQQAFIDTGGVQCGFCTPGMVMAATDLLTHNPKPTFEEIREGLAGNLCRCTGYTKIFQAVELAAQRMASK